ncbi:MAG TPA: zinc-ribbon domain-containing protein [Blastocatellia bacterium]|nr:zinc-ribbon domain-containing protein [Blastocatellia bacterium]
MEDRTLTCADCGQPFTFSAGEQQFFQERGMSEPKRCKACRQARKAERGSGGRGQRRGGPGGGSGGGGRGGSHNRW